MKKVTLFLMACCMAVLSFAAGGNITYVLNGGVTNDDGWQDKNDLYMGLYQSWNSFKGGEQTQWKTLAELAVSANPVTDGIPTQAPSMDLTFIQDPTVAAKWQWLFNYLDATCTAQGQTLPSTNASYLRYNLAAFFVNSVRTTWPVSADYSVAGQPSAFTPAWKHAFAGPATYDGTATITLPDPYKEGATFDGWYESANFTGEKITSIAAGTDGDKTLYAKWIEYIPTCSEVWALAAGTTTKATGIVTLVNGTTAYIQDTSAGLQVEFTAAPTIAAGDKISISGTTATLGEYVTVTNASLTSKETGEIPAHQTLLLAALLADARSYMFEYIYLEGLVITANNGTTATVSDGVNTITLAIALDQSTYPVNTKVNTKATVSYTDAIILTGASGNVTLAPVPRPDGVAYPTIDGKYTLTSRWLVSNTLDNFTSNPIASAGSMVRGMTAKDGKLYFIDRGLHQITVVDGASGEKLAPIVLDDNQFFKYTNEEGNLVDAGTLRYNDIKQDAAGNILLANCIASNAQPFQVWKVNLATGSGTLVLNDILANNPDFSAATIRFDAFGIYGNVDQDAIIMAANASALEAYKWTITNGIASQAEAIIIDSSQEGTFLTGLTNPGSAPQVFPLDNNYFYLDGNATLPTLIDMEGNIVDGFYNTENWTLGNNAGHNGLIEFELGGEHFFLIASMNTAGTPPSTFTLFKWRDANKEFKDIQLLWTLPAAGMGSASNPYRTAVPSVEVNETTKTATLYLYTGENGYGVYEFTVDDGNHIPQAPKSAITLTIAGNQVRLSETASAIKVYNTVGQLLQSTGSASTITITGSGVYILSIQNSQGEAITRKVIIH
jgi:uncharacterized repeat protein (TIGR02543 family)